MISPPHVLIALAVFVAVGIAPADAAPRAEGQVILIGTSGLRWDDLNASTPALNSLLDGAIGLLAVRSVRSTACPVDGWLAVSAGRRAGDLRRDDAPGADCRDIRLSVPAAGGSAVVPDWLDYRRAADEQLFDAQPGLLGRTLTAAGRSFVAVGPGAAIALAVPAMDGRSATIPRAFAGSADANGLGDEIGMAVAMKPDVLAIDIGSVRAGANRSEQVAQLDIRLGVALSRLPSSTTTIVASLADDGTRPRLRLISAFGASPVPGPRGERSYLAALLGSTSTRQRGIVQGTDLTPTLLAAVGIDLPAETVGAPMRPAAHQDARDRWQLLNDLDDASNAVIPIVPWFFNGLVISQVLLYALATMMLRSRSREMWENAEVAKRPRGLRILGITSVILASVPSATFLANLVPWWRANMPWLALMVAVMVAALLISLLALFGPWSSRLLGPLGTVGGVTAVVLASDVLTGSHLMLSSLMGVQPVVAGRFYGFGNVAFALFATGAMLFAIALADPLVRMGRARAAVATVAGIGLLTLTLDGTPGLGSDFGGPPAIVPGFAVLTVLVAGIRLNWLRAALIAILTIAVLVGLAVVDWLRPAQERTHLGRFVATVLDGGTWSVISRKASQNLDILFTSWLSALLLVAIIFFTLVLNRPASGGIRPLQNVYDRSPVLQPGLVGLAVMLGIGSALNDSGTVVPAVATAVVVPLLIAASTMALERGNVSRVDVAAIPASTYIPPSP